MAARGGALKRRGHSSSSIPLFSVSRPQRRTRSPTYTIMDPESQPLVQGTSESQAKTGHVELEEDEGFNFDDVIFLVGSLFLPTKKLRECLVLDRRIFFQDPSSTA